MDVKFWVFNKQNNTSTAFNDKYLLPGKRNSYIYSLFLIYYKYRAFLEFSYSKKL